MWVFVWFSFRARLYKVVLTHPLLIPTLFVLHHPVFARVAPVAMACSSASNDVLISRLEGWIRIRPGVRAASEGIGKGDVARGCGKGKKNLGCDGPHHLHPASERMHWSHGIRDFVAHVHQRAQSAHALFRFLMKERRYK